MNVLPRLDGSIRNTLPPRQIPPVRCVGKRQRGSFPDAGEHSCLHVFPRNDVIWIGFVVGNPTVEFRLPLFGQLRNDVAFRDAIPRCFDQLELLVVAELAGLVERGAIYGLSYTYMYFQRMLQMQFFDSAYARQACLPCTGRGW